MFVGPFPVSSVIERLRSQVPRLKIVGGAADLEAAKDAPRATPAAFVVAEERATRPKGYSGGVLVQQATPWIQVVYSVKDVSDPSKGDAARRLMEELIAEGRAALVNWSPGAAFERLYFNAGRAERFWAGTLAYQESFRSGYRISMPA